MPGVRLLGLALLLLHRVLLGLAEDVLVGTCDRVEYLVHLKRPFRVAPRALLRVVLLLHARRGCRVVVRPVLGALAALGRLLPLGAAVGGERRRMGHLSAVLAVLVVRREELLQHVGR